MKNAYMLRGDWWLKVKLLGRNLFNQLPNDANLAVRHFEELRRASVKRAIRLGRCHCPPAGRFHTHGALSPLGQRHGSSSGFLGASEAGAGSVLFSLAFSPGVSTLRRCPYISSSTNGTQL